MSENNSNPPRQVLPELKRLEQPAQNSIRTSLRIAGPLFLLTGVVCLIIAIASMFSGSNDFGPPRLFWLAFVGIPLLFVGTVLSMYGFMGAVARFIAGESAPVAADTVNYMAEETKGAVETVAKAAAKGIVKGINAGHEESVQGKD
jgi:hypothetical protein